jgi:hypothetical protein
MRAVRASIRTLSLTALLLCACGDGGAVTSDGDFVPEVTERGTFQVLIRVDEGSFRRGMNALTVTALDGSGAPAELREVRARMPGHVHEVVRPTIRAVSGAWRVEALEMTMPGRWEVSFRFAQGSAQDEAIALTSLR